MKKYINIILIGAASHSKNNIGGQIPYIKDIINEYVSVIAADPQHKYESDSYLMDKSGVNINRGYSPSVLNLKCLNVYNMYSSEIFMDLTPSSDTFYLVLTYTGIERENPSFNVSRKLGIKKSFFHNPENALFLSFGCLAVRPNLKLLLEKLGIYSGFNTNDLYNNLYQLFQLQNAYYAYQNNIDALYRTNIMPEWGEKSMHKLRHIGIKNMLELRIYYEKITDYKNMGIERLIKEELNKLHLLEFWDERPNDFH